jgi:hypothetical protein
MISARIGAEMISPRAATTTSREVNICPPNGGAAEAAPC